MSFENGFNWGDLEKKLNANITSKKKSFIDDRFWKLSRDENESGGAIIRLIPDSSGVPFIQRFSHGISSFDSVQKRQRWYLHNSPQTIGLPCPASELSRSLFTIGSEEAKKEAKKFNRKMQFVTNIKVIKDPANPQNEGKIFLWSFGPKLKDKFMAALTPSDSEVAMGEEPKQLYHPLKGHNIKLKIKKVAGFLNYDDTEIMSQSSAYSDMEEAKKDITENSFNVEELNAEKEFLTYEELKGKLKYVLETYKPEFLTESEFKEISDSVFKVTETPDQVQVTVPTQVVPKPVPTPTEDHKTTDLDDDLDFLDEL